VATGTGSKDPRPEILIDPAPAAGAGIGPVFNGLAGEPAAQVQRCE